MCQAEALRTKLVSLSTALVNKLDNFHTKYPSYLPELDKLLNPILNHPISVELAIRNKAPFLEPPSPPSELKNIQTSLASITKALSDLQRKVNSTPPTSTPKAPTANSKAPSVTLLWAQGPDVGRLRSECALSSTRRSWFNGGWSPYSVSTCKARLSQWASKCSLCKGLS
jgi:hypothetical protein